MKLAIYGAQAIALGTYIAINELYKEGIISCFIVTKMGNNASFLAGIPVKELSDFSAGLAKEDKDDIRVLIATPETVMDEIESGLISEGFTNIDRVDSVKWADLQERYWKLKGRFIPLSVFEAGNDISDINIYMTKFWKDKALNSTYVFNSYYHPIQAGAANTDVRVADIIDCEGDNISTKNPNYSELTALYWIWKHRMDGTGYLGLAHYRRFLELSDEDIKRLYANNIDVVLPYPMPYEPNIGEHHKRYLSDAEWAAVLQALRELQPEYYNCLNDVMSNEYMYNYNIIVAKSDVLKDYCSWLFPILFRVEEIVDPDGIKEPNRYIGYIGETLETVYFMVNKDRLKIAHTGCRFLV